MIKFENISKVYPMGKRDLTVLKGVSFEIKKGDVVFIPENVPHWYQNIGDETFEFLCIVPNKPDTTTVLPEESQC